MPRRDPPIRAASGAESCSRATRAGGRPLSRAGRTLLVLFFCAGVAGLGLFTGGEFKSARAVRDPLAGYYPPDMPRYPQVREVAAGRSRVGRTPMRMSYFHTEHGPARVGDYYANFWRKRRFWVTSDVTHTGGIVAAVDAHHGRVYQVLIRKQGKYTLVFPSVNDSPMSALARAEAPPVTLYKDSKLLTNTMTRAGGNEAQIVLSTNGGTLEENRAHYRGALAQAGYKEVVGARRQIKRRAGLARSMLVFRNEKGGELTVVLTTLDKERTRVHITKVSSVDKK